MSTNPQDTTTERPEQPTLFELPEEAASPRGNSLANRPPRVITPNREQVICLPQALNDLLPEDHPARVIWAYVNGLDLTALYAGLRSVEGHAGRDIADRRVYMALWLYATIRGVGAARELERLCQRHADYRWICGGVPVNYHTLADFRTQHGDWLDRLLTQSVASLMAEGLVTLERVAQDGMKVRASAGAASFRRRPTLEEALAEVEEQVAQLRKELEGDPAATKTRQQAARQRAAAECVNALARNRGLQRFQVRGLQKVKAVVLWYVLAHNLMRAVALRAAAAQGAVNSG